MKFCLNKIANDARFDSASRPNDSNHDLKTKLKIIDHGRLKAMPLPSCRLKHLFDNVIASRGVFGKSDATMCAK